MASSKAKVLIVSSRFPWPTIRGDRLRVLVWLEALREVADVTLAAPDGDMPQAFSDVRLIAAKRTVSSLIRTLFGVLFRGWPLQVAYAPLDWRRALSGLGREESFDAAIVLLSRTDPVVRPHIRARVRILDAVDSLARSMKERRDAAKPGMRFFWTLEQRRMAHFECGVSRHYDRVVVVSPDEARDFGPHAIAISNGVEILPLDSAPREFDFGFWGRIAYFANLDAVEILVGTIWPLIREVHPDATLAIAGADVPGGVMRYDGQDGIRVLSPVEDRASHLRQVRIMLFPIRYGTGQLNKVLESAEGGCAIVATSMAMRGLDALRPDVCVEDEAKAFAERAAGLLGDEVELRDRAALTRAAVEMHYSRSASIAALQRLVKEAAR